MKLTEYICTAKHSVSPRQFKELEFLAVLTVSVFLCLLGCQSKSDAGPHMGERTDGATQAESRANPPQQNFAVADIGKEGSPKLTQPQLNDVHSVLHCINTTAGRRLRYAFARSGATSLFVIYDPGPVSLGNEGASQLPVVLNIKALWYYDPTWNELVQSAPGDTRPRPRCP